MPSSFFHGVEVIEIDQGIRPIQTVRSSVIGLIGTAESADETLFPLNEPVLIANRSEASKLGKEGSLVDAVNLIYDQVGALVVVIRVKDDVNQEQLLSNVVGGVDESERRLGLYALLDTESKLGLKPKILIAPSFTSNPSVTSKLVTIAESLKAIVVAEAPSTTDQAAVDFKRNFDSARVYIIDPNIFILKDGDKSLTSSSAAVAGLIAKIDHQYGWHLSPSNHQLNGIIGAQRSIDYSYSEASKANYLNEQNINVIIRQNGWRLWGNRTTSTDPKWQFLCVRRTADMINESLLYAHQWAVDRGITKTFVEDVVMGVNDYLRSLIAQGRILGGKCWVDPIVNTNNNVKNGHIIFDFDFTPVYPAERISFRSRLTDDYLEEIF
ncbi:phage tail sheath subtilisin-like domain-containing protein [Thiotrichales bacterium 19S11-10]|nr:phage tail sheath subtilisin-like domain-containing protein [Thiotrichales bacterium 19S11-10]MCF6808526.1 phage tail sheath subtilisin-like domain-containing protein [Thiotrichales bacterium 19S9-11]MCF6812496.1 phage tail sheath subtilisin-like domain-containing protein [Thiotrichales bacterium 19S9-12]